MKNDFISAYIYAYGSTKKEAEKAYKTASPEYIAAIIEGHKRDARAGFYND